MADQQKSIRNATFWLSSYLAALFVCYCLVYLCACPSKQLAMAIAAEAGALLISIAIFKANVLALPSLLMDRLPERVAKVISSLNNVMQWCRVAVLSVVMLFATIDFSALALAAAGQTNASVAIYSTVPTSYWLGFHPAFTLEMLAGALVENQNFERAEPLYKSLLAVRLKLCGPTSDLAGAIYADLGDFYVRKHELVVAEQWYRRSISLGVRTGRGYTALATVLREEGRLSESHDFYLKALDVRKRVYGQSSKQYQDTLRGYMHLQHMMMPGTFIR
ncbi:MAG TPA: tetratricopeptide repeat protein [Candidatus Obscuribacterales bacterium]